MSKKDIPLDQMFPFFECTQEKFDYYCQGMTDKGRQQLAYLLAHRCLLAGRDENGWVLTRKDLAERSTFWHVSNDGELTYGYKDLVGKRHPTLSEEYLETLYNLLGVVNQTDARHKIIDLIRKEVDSK